MKFLEIFPFKMKTAYLLIQRCSVNTYKCLPGIPILLVLVNSVWFLPPDVKFWKAWHEGSPYPILFPLVSNLS